MTLNNNNQSTADLDHIKSTSELIPDCSKLTSDGDFKDIQLTSNEFQNCIPPSSDSYQIVISQYSSSVNVNCLDNDNLLLVFSHFTLLEWVIVLRVVCKRWYDILLPKCFEMFAPLPFINTPLDQKGHYFFQRVHVFQFLSERYLRWRYLRRRPWDRVDYSEEKIEEVKRDRFIGAFKDDLKHYERSISKILSFHFGPKNLPFLLLNVSNFWETNKKAKKQIGGHPMLLSVSVFGYVTGQDWECFSENMSKVMHSISAIQSHFEFFSLNQITPADSRNFVPFQKLSTFMQSYTLHYTGQCPIRFTRQLDKICDQMRPHKLLERVLLDDHDQDWTNGNIITFRLSTSHSKQLLPFVFPAAIHNCLFVESLGESIKFDLNFVSTFLCCYRVEKLCITNVLIDLISLEPYLANTLPKDVNSIARMKCLKLINLQTLFSHKDEAYAKLDKTQQDRLCACQTMLILALLFPRLERLTIVCGNSTFGLKIWKQHPLFPKLKKYKFVNL